VRILSGEGPVQLAENLEKRGLVRSRWAFLWALHRQGGWSHVRAGAYRLSADMTPDEIAERIRRGGQEQGEEKVTIPEGYTARQIAQTLAAKHVVENAESFLAVTAEKSPPVSAPFKLPSTGLEGYLFPDTYFFSPNMRPDKAAQAMLDNFAQRFYRPYRDQIQHSNHPLHEIVTIASLVEREAEVPEDRPRIAGVIENRLARHMRLQIDATVLYALGHHKDRVLYQDLAVSSPYNTYRHAGLPPGPIANPGLESLRAALNPERSDYLFYVAGPGGAHVFAHTEAEHLRNVAHMRALRKAQALPAVR
jgi:UPF0755 protein